MNIKPVSRINWDEIADEIICATVSPTGDIFLHKYTPKRDEDWGGFMSLDMEYYGTIFLPPEIDCNKVIFKRPILQLA